MKQLAIGIAAVVGTLLVTFVPSLHAFAPLWPVVVAFAVILLTREAATGLAAGVIAGCLILNQVNPIDAARSLLADHMLPQITGSWHVSALLFTLILGAFTGVLEASGGFSALMRKGLSGARRSKRQVLGTVYGMGLICFFDGLANSMLMGRVARPAVDSVGVSREKLAWVVDSTSSPVACVAFISSWIAFQLTLIGDSLPGSEPYQLYFQSIPANPYCLLTLLLVPLAIFRNWEPGLMRRYQASKDTGESQDTNVSEPWRVLAPLAILAASIMVSLQIFSGNDINLFSLEAWRTAASSDGTPLALIGGSLAGLAAAWIFFPSDRRHEVGPAMLKGAAGLLPALVILILAWCLGSVFEASGTAEPIQELLGSRMSPQWLPLAVFAVTSLTAFFTGSSWGTMALLMPLALDTLTGVGIAGSELAFAPGIIGAVFGGAVFGDHCSPFSDTTVVSALASGCRPIDHVISQLPYALTAATASLLAYILMALSLSAPVSTMIAGLLLSGFVVLRSPASSPR